MTDYAALVRRMEWGIVGWGAVFAVAAGVGWGGLAALGVASGAAAAWANFRWLERAFSRPTPARAGLLGLRLAALAGVGYVMLKIFAVTPVTFLIGLLTAAAAALGEALYQLIYARIS
ncbi:MAG: hypothetical protein NTX13_19730 [Acidobacteria bacterium]|nr:hypothetical protein [Acidobacteriota bacterium]